MHGSAGHCGKGRPTAAQCGSATPVGTLGTWVQLQRSSQVTRGLCRWMGHVKPITLQDTLADGDSRRWSHTPGRHLAPLHTPTRADGSAPAPQQPRCPVLGRAQHLHRRRHEVPTRSRRSSAPEPTHGAAGARPQRTPAGATGRPRPPRAAAEVTAAAPVQGTLVGQPGWQQPPVPTDKAASLPVRAAGWTGRRPARRDL